MTTTSQRRERRKLLGRDVVLLCTTKKSSLFGFFPLFFATTVVGFFRMVNVKRIMMIYLELAPFLATTMQVNVEGVVNEMLNIQNTDFFPEQSK